MAQHEWYRDWFNSPFYHKLYFSRDETEAARVIAPLLNHLQPPPGSRMLDAGCGRGRHSRLLAEKGFEVIGVDLTHGNIRAAAQYQSDHLQFYVHDLRLPFWINYFDYAFSLFTSFGYFATRREHDDAVRTIAASLKPGGTVVFDYLNVHYVEDHLVHNEVKNIGETRYDIQRWHDAGHFYKKITIADPSISEPLQVTEKIAKFSLGDFTDMLSFQGVQVQEVFGSYELEPYDVRKKERMIVLASKKEAS